MSIVGAGMRFVGDCETEGAIRIEGIVEGSVRAGGEVVIGEKGVVRGDVRAHAASVAGHVHGTLTAELLLELRETSRLDGEVYARRIRVGDGAVVNAAVHMGEEALAGLDAKAAPTPLRLEHAHDVEELAVAGGGREARRRTS